MFSGVIVMMSALQGGEAEPAYQFKLRKMDDGIVAVKEAKRTLFVVTSPSGIGDGTIVLKAGAWPENVSLRYLHGKKQGFKNLEQFRLTTDRVHVEGDLKSAGKFRFCFLDAKRTPGEIESGKRASAGELNVRVEMRDGALELDFPAWLFVGSKQVELRWVNEFR